MSTRIHGVQLIAFIGALFAVAHNTATAQVQTADSLAMVALYNGTDGANWIDSSNWLVGSLSTWHGLSVQGGRIRVISLSDNNLVGPIPPEFGDLTGVRQILLRGNQLSGPIPPEIGDLTTLNEDLHLGNNQLSGPIPPEIGNLIGLRQLRLEGNQLTGSIPVELGNLTNLFRLFLQGNQLTGEIPTEIVELTGVWDLGLSDNQLTGEIPAGIADLTGMTRLHLFGNQLSGEIPATIGSMTNLTELWLHNNQLTGPIPSEIGNLVNLERLFLENNQLSGDIPSELGSLVNLAWLTIQNNQLTGAIPEAFGSFTSLSNLVLEDNLIEDLPDLSGVSTLTSLFIRRNRFTFEDIEPNLGVAQFAYTQQDSVGMPEVVAVQLGSEATVSIDVGGTGNEYQWFKDGVEIAGATGSSYTIDAVGESDLGAYVCRITSTVVTGLTLFSRPRNMVIGPPTDVDDHEVPGTFTLHPNYPNPFNPSTTITYDLPHGEYVRLKIFNVLGEEIRTIVDRRQSAGRMSVTWNGTDQAGLPVSTGVYIYRLEAGEKVQSRTLLLMK